MPLKAGDASVSSIAQPAACGASVRRPASRPTSTSAPLASSGLQAQVLVAGERMILCDEQLARAQYEKRNERRHPWPAGDHLDEREPGPRERRKVRGDRDEDH